MNTPGANPNNIEKYSQMTQVDIKLFKAIESMDEDAVKTALDNGASPDAIEPSTKTKYKIYPKNTYRLSSKEW
jgi:hypothetical protein